MLKRFFSIFALIFFVTSILSSQPQRQMQGGSITGTVIEESTNKGVEYANIVLFNAKDSSQVNGTVSAGDGKFEITGVRPGVYYLTVHFIGFDTERINDIRVNRNNLNPNVGTIKIKPATVNLNDVVIQGERVPVSYQIDKKVINVDQMATTISGSAVEVLENIPSVTVDIEGNVSLRGSGSFTVLVDGRPTIVDAQDVLQQIPASSIENIEVITNPSAKYDPEGTAGIINIVLKKNKNFGASGLVNLNAGLNDKYGGDILTEFKNSDFTAVLGFDYNNRFFTGNSTQERIFSYQNNTSYINSTGDNSRGRRHYGFRGSLNYNLSDNDVIGISGRAGNRKMQGSSSSNYLSYSDNDPANTNYLNIGERERSGSFYSAGINYQHKFAAKGHELSADFIYEYDEGDEENISEMIMAQNIVEGRKTTENGPGKELNARLDYILPLGEKSKFETGFEGESERNDENTGFYLYDTQSNDYVIQPRFSYFTKTEKDEYALYSIFSSMIDNFGFQGGIRGEYTYRKIDLPELGNSFKIDQWDYFPTVHLSYKFPTGQQLMTSYTRRIQRPRGWALEPFDTWMDANNVRRGNPSLVPEFIDSYELGFQTLLGQVSFSVEGYYRINNNKIEWVRSVYEGAEDVTLQTFANIGKDFALGTEIMMSFNPVKIWSVDLMGNLYDYRLQGNIFGEEISKSSFNWRTRMNNSFKLGETWQFQINANYISPSISSQGRSEGFFMTDLALRKDLFDKKLTLTLQARDLFGTFKHESTTQSLGLYSYQSFERESPMLMLNVKYSLNNFRQQRDRQGPNDDGGGDDEF